MGTVVTGVPFESEHRQLSGVVPRERFRRLSSPEDEGFVFGLVGSSLDLAMKRVWYTI